MSDILSEQKGKTWIDKDEITTGNWTVLKTKKGNFFMLDDNFETPNGPDLKIYLGKKEMANIGINEAVHIDGLYIDELKAIKGKHQYNLPNSETLSSYKSIVILCEKYSVVWGGIDLYEIKQK
jgi:hypothetical protein